MFPTTTRPDRPPCPECRQYISDVVSCPKCGAAVHELCRTPDGQRYEHHHIDRVMVAGALWTQIDPTSSRALLDAPSCNQLRPSRTWQEIAAIDRRYQQRHEVRTGYPSPRYPDLTEEPRVLCFTCGRDVAVTQRGTLRRHKDRGNWCVASNKPVPASAFTPTTSEYMMAHFGELLRWQLSRLIPS